MKARDMNLNQYTQWEQRRAGLCRLVASAEWVDSALRMYTAKAPVQGLSTLTVVEQVGKNIERLASSDKGLEYWAVY